MTWYNTSDHALSAISELLFVSLMTAVADGPNIVQKHGIKIDSYSIQGSETIITMISHRVWTH